MCPFGEDDGCKSGDGSSDRDGFGRNWEGGLTRIGGALRGICASVVVPSRLGMSVRGGGQRNKVSAVMSGGGDACKSALGAS